MVIVTGSLTYSLTRCGPLRVSSPHCRQCRQNIAFGGIQCRCPR